MAASFDDFRSETPDAIVVDYLYTEKARNVLSLAKLKLDTFEVLFAENNNFLEDVRKMVSTAGE
ncbi:hypothetical protein GCM10023156_13180 [Novipirellula rosea]|uniref:Uncharacterized protein n=1 Tax=Novipirellula rosea TaxID=1031540 RepID=A0ABP8ME77_9BACT